MCKQAGDSNPTKLKIMENNIFIGQTRKAFAPYYRNVTIRKITGNYVTVSLGFDTKGNDTLTVVHRDDVLPK